MGPFVPDSASGKRSHEVLQASHPHYAQGQRRVFWRGQKDANSASYYNLKPWLDVYRCRVFRERRTIMDLDLTRLVLFDRFIRLTDLFLKVALRRDGLVLVDGLVDERVRRVVRDGGRAVFNMIFEPDRDLDLLLRECLHTPRLMFVAPCRRARQKFVNVLRMPFAALAQTGR